MHILFNYKIFHLENNTKISCDLKHSFLCYFYLIFDWLIKLNLYDYMVSIYFILLLISSYE